jgi:hypothetical protein
MAIQMSFLQHIGSFWPEKQDKSWQPPLFSREQWWLSIAKQLLSLRPINSYGIYTTLFFTTQRFIHLRPFLEIPAFKHGEERKPLASGTPRALAFTPLFLPYATICSLKASITITKRKSEWTRAQKTFGRA